MGTTKKIFCLIAIQLAVFAIFGIVWHVNFPNTPLLNENGVLGKFTCRFKILDR